MNDREKNILSAAERVFTRFGYKRASMSDVAEEAGISRQTLYKAFSSKEDILKTHIVVYTDMALVEIESGLAQTEGLAARLNLVLDKMVVVGFDMVRATPNAQDIIDGVNTATKEELEVSAGRFQAVIKDVLAPYDTALKETGTNAQDLAEYIQRSARAAKDFARDKQQLMQHLGMIVVLCERAAGLR